MPIMTGPCLGVCLGAVFLFSIKGFAIIEMRTYTRAVVVAFTCALVVSVTVPCFARGDEQSDLIAQKSLHAAEIAAQEKDAIRLSDEASRLENELKGVTDSLTKTSERLRQAQTNVAHLVSFQYRSGMKVGLLDVILSSKDWSELASRVMYATKVNTSLINSVKAVKDEQAALRAEKSHLIDLMRQKQENVDKVQRAIQQLREKNVRIDSRLEALAKQAAAEKAAQEASRKAAERAKQSIVQEALQKSHQPSTSSERAQTGGERKSAGASAGRGASSVSTNAAHNPGNGVWQTGRASAYDDVGQPVAMFPFFLDETTPTVAVPMAWKDYRSYFGRYVKITYRSKTVIARCIDCGYLADGDRSLDLSPACYRALGASSAQDWGVRTVSFTWL